MNWNTIFTAVILSVGGSLVFGGLVIWLLKTWITNRIQADVQHVYDMRMAKIKSELEKEKELFKRDLEAKVGDVADEKEADKVLFKQLMDDLPSLGIIHDLKHIDMYEPIDTHRVKELLSFRMKWSVPEKQFFNLDLEEKRKHLYLKIQEFNDLGGICLFYEEDSMDRKHVPKEWRTSHPDKWNECVNGMNKLADEIALAHENIVSTGHQKLKV